MQMWVKKGGTLDIMARISLLGLSKCLEVHFSGTPSYIGISRHYIKSSDCFEYPKKSVLKSRHPPKKYFPNFQTPKNPSIIPVTGNLEYPPPPSGLAWKGPLGPSPSSLFYTQFYTHAKHWILWTWILVLNSSLICFQAYFWHQEATGNGSLESQGRLKISGLNWATSTSHHSWADKAEWWCRGL